MNYDHLSPLAQQLGAWMAERCLNGLPSHFDDDLLEAFSGSTKNEVTDALYELKADGLVELTPLLGPKLPRVRTTYELFVAADPVVTGDDPLQDAAELAQLMIKDEGMGNIPKLEAAVGWPRRRFNAALGQLVPLWRDGRISQSIQNEYPTRQLFIGPEERIELKRFIEAQG